MPYSTPKLVREALVPSYDGSNPGFKTNTAADLPDNAITDAIAEADSTIDAYIGARYTAPIDVTAGVPHPIDYWSRNIAAYLATLTYRGSQDFTDTDPIARRYSATMTALTAVRDGKALLPLPDNESPTGTAGAGAPINPNSGDLFNPCDFNLGYAVGPSRGDWGWSGGL